MVIHHRIFQNAVDIIAGFAERDFLNPVHYIDAACAWVAIGAKPFVHVTRTAIIGGNGQGIASVIIIEHALNIGGTQGDVVIGINGQRIRTIGH